VEAAEGAWRAGFVRAKKLRTSSLSRAGIRGGFSGLLHEDYQTVR
jgi:hypothetical protein